MFKKFLKIFNNCINHKWLWIKLIKYLSLSVSVAEKAVKIIPKFHFLKTHFPDIPYQNQNQCTDYDLK